MSPSSLVYALNLFGFALIKRVTILAMIAIGLGIIPCGFGPQGDTAGFSKLRGHGGFPPTASAACSPRCRS